MTCWGSCDNCSRALGKQKPNQSVAGLSLSWEAYVKRPILPQGTAAQVQKLSWPDF
jgi:hypothetical protein